MVARSAKVITLLQTFYSLILYRNTVANQSDYPHSVLID